MNGNKVKQFELDENGVMKSLPSVSLVERMHEEKERKAKTTLLMALPEKHLSEFHGLFSAKHVWNAIKNKFGGNEETKAMNLYVLKEQFEVF